METTKPVLHYFPGNGRAALIRAIFDVKGIDYTNDYIQMQNWAQEKPKQEFGQLPTLDIDGLNLSQSIAIILYLGKKYNLLGSSLKDEYLITSTLLAAEDLTSNHISKIMRPQGNDQINAVEENKKALANVHAPAFFKILEKRFVDNSKKYFLGDTLTILDIFAAVNLGTLLAKFGLKSVLEKEAPKLNAHVDNLIATDLKPFFDKSYLKDAPF